MPVLSEYVNEAKVAAREAYADWKKIADKPGDVNAVSVKRLRTSGSGEMVNVIARHILLARARQADVDGKLRTALELRQAVLDLE